MRDVDYLRVEAIEWGPRILGAIAILVVAWLIAKAAKGLVSRGVDKIPALRKHYEAEPGRTLGSMLGDVVFWLILLIGIMLALQPLNLGTVLEPVRELTTNAFSFIPNILGAGLIFFIGLVVARIVRRLVETALLAADVEKWVGKASAIGPQDSPGAGAAAAGTAPSVNKGALSRSIGMVVFFLIMIPVTISALDALKIEAISAPATAMLRTILDSIPNILGALILLAIGFMIGKLAKQAIEQILPNLGFDQAVSALGLSRAGTAPSRTVGSAVLIAILIFFAIKAAELLNSPLIAAMLAQILELGSRVLFGVVIILGGVAIARIVAGLVGGEGWLPAILRWSIIALAVAMGLRFMGLANEIVIIGFTAIIGSAAVASALAFGLGGRPTAHKLLEQWSNNLPPAPPAVPRAPSPPAPPTPPTPPAEPSGSTVPPSV